VRSRTSRATWLYALAACILVTMALATSLSASKVLARSSGGSTIGLGCALWIAQSLIYLLLLFVGPIVRRLRRAFADRLSFRRSEIWAWAVWALFMAAALGALGLVCDAQPT